jgi:hypothetical protein
MRGVQYEPLELKIERELTPRQYEDLLAALGGMTRNHQWWVGDALVYGESRWGEEAAQYADALGLAAKTMVNWRYVASSVTRSRRRDDLGWSHHAEVARLGSDAQRTTLAKAAKAGWTVMQLRDYVAITYPQSQPQLFGDDDGLSPQTAREERDTQHRTSRRSSAASTAARSRRTTCGG